MLSGTVLPRWKVLSIVTFVLFARTTIRIRTASVLLLLVPIPLFRGLGGYWVRELLNQWVHFVCGLVDHPFVTYRAISQSFPTVAEKGYLNPSEDKHYFSQPENQITTNFWRYPGLWSNPLHLVYPWSSYTVEIIPPRSVDFNSIGPGTVLSDYFVATDNRSCAFQNPFMRFYGSGDCPPRECL